MKRDRLKIVNRLAKQERTSSYADQIAQTFCPDPFYYFLDYLLTKNIYKEDVLSF